MRKTPLRAGKLSLNYLWAIGPIAVAWLTSSVGYIEPYDFWWNVKGGELMVQAGHVVNPDLLVWTPGREGYANSQWGAQVLFYWLYSLSPYLLLTARVLIVSATIGLLLALCRLRSGSLRVASLAVLLTLLLVSTNQAMRAQLFAFLPFMGFLFLLALKEAQPRWLVALIPIMLFWVNVHGSFVLGLLLMGCHVMADLWRWVTRKKGKRPLVSREVLWQWACYMAAGLATLANPYFVGVYSSFVTVSSDPIIRSAITEWQPTSLRTAPGLLFGISLVTMAVSLYVSKRRLGGAETLIVLVFAYLGFTALRNVLWWGLASAPVLATNMAAWADRWKLQRSGEYEHGGSTDRGLVKAGLPALNWAIMALLIGGALLFTPLWRTYNPLVPPASRTALHSDTPVEIGEFLAELSVPEPVFNHMEWGGYLGWRLYPRYRMFVDGRIEARQLRVWQDYLAISDGQSDPLRSLDEYGVRTLILSKWFQSGLITQVETSGDWSKVYEDNKGVIYTR